MGESAYRKQCKYARNFYENGVFTYNSDEYLKELELQKQELFKAKKQFYDQRREYNKLPTRNARMEHLIEELVHSVGRMNRVHPMNHFINTYKDSTLHSCRTKRNGVLFLADWHYGMVTNNIWNVYNADICKERVAKLTQEVIADILDQGISKLYIVSLGDEIHGAIHVTARIAAEEETCDQLMNVSEIMATMFNELTNYVDVEYYSCYGNHSRTIQNKKESVHRDNMGRVIPWWIEQRLKDNDRFHVIYSEYDEFTKLNICGYNICCVHGDLDNIRNLGQTVNTIFSRKYGETIDYTVSADKHHLEEFEQFDIENILIRSLCGTDDHSNSKRLYSTPGQTLMIFDEEHGRLCTYNIKL
ncbi:MAG: hypothetical protein ACLTBR_03410 [Anaerostipes sp.]|uniref:hypothetical protein n=1 Tax=Anaerostipes sp. TaxID=1872530 RepID=UPI003992C5C1